jgi:methionine synthase I (cobalamin-dependent)
MNELEGDGQWKWRIGGIRANASLKSHAELDESNSLDTGDKCLLAQGYADLFDLLPNLKVIGGCCGTDHSHLAQICEQVLTES